MIKNNIKLVLILLAALIIRLIVIYPQFSGDAKNHLVWGESLVSSGAQGLFTRHFSGFNDANYPALTILFFGFCRELYHLVNNFIIWQNFSAKFLPSRLVPLFLSQNMQVAFMKLPAVFADLGVGYLIYQIIKRRRPKEAWLWVVLYLFNPAVIYISAVWGQIESIPIFFLALSFYFLPKRYYLSHIAFVLAILSKQTALWLTPIFLIIWWKEGGVRKMIYGLFVQLMVFVLIYLPFASPGSATSSYLATLAGSSNSITDQAFNLWYFIYGWQTRPDNLLLLGLTVRFWSLILVGISYLYLCISFFKKYKLELTADYLFFLSLIAFFFQTRVHERHLAPTIPLLLISTIPTRYKIPLFLLLSTYHFVNLYSALRLPFI